MIQQITAVRDTGNGTNISLYRNRRGDIDTADNLLLPFGGLPALRQLKLKGNQLETLTSPAFQGLKNLTTLDLRSNMILLVQSQAFDASHIPVLTTLKMASFSNPTVCSFVPGDSGSSTFNANTRTSIVCSCGFDKFSQGGILPGGEEGACLCPLSLIHI